MKYWVSCLKFTVKSETDDNGKIVDATPVVQVFIGQPLNNLISWFERFGKTRYVDLKKVM